MRVHIDISHLNTLNEFRGIGVYSRLLFDHLKNILKDEVVLVEKPTTEPCDIVHYPYFDLFFDTLPLRKSAKTVITIHDVIPLIYPKQYKPGIKGSIRFFKQLVSLRSVDAILTDSECSKTDIIKYLGVPEKKVYVTYLAGNPEMTKQSVQIVSDVRKKYSLPQDYILYVGDINYNKNLPALIQAFAHIPKKYSLVLVGKAMNNTEIPEGKALHDAIKSTDTSRRITMLTNVPKEPASDLAAIYTVAKVYIQPSLYEGFGLPVLDAMQCETVIVSSRSSSLREVAGDAAIYFHPKSVDEIRDALSKALALSPKEKEALIEREKKNVRKFSWEKTAKETVDVYRKVLEA